MSTRDKLERFESGGRDGPEPERGGSAGDPLRRLSGLLARLPGIGEKSAMRLALAMVKADSVDPQVYLDQLFKTDYQGVTARIGFDANGELKNPAMTLYEYRNGKKVPLN